MGEATKCPHCQEPISVGMVAELTAESRFKFVLTPELGALLSAKTVGGTISEMEKLIVGEAKRDGFRAKLLVEKITAIDGEIVIEFLVARTRSSESSHV